MHHPTRLLSLGFAIVILMMIALAYLAFQSTRGNGSDITQQIELQIQKINLIHDLSTIIHDRTRFMQSMLLARQGIHRERILAQFQPHEWCLRS